MIHFALAAASRQIGIERYLATRGADIAHLMQAHAYEDLAHARTLPAGTWIFASVDVLTPAMRRMAALVRQRVIDAGHQTLNDPFASLRRYELLTRLYESGVNTFRAVRAREYRGDLRYPVFIRDESRHNGDISGLLHSDRQVRQDLLSARLRGHSVDDLLVVEFCDSSVDGLFRKYSAFRVGDRILARHAQTSSHWMVKSETGERSADTAAFEAAFIEENPHAEQLMALFTTANIQYGRMDYGLIGDRIQVWEINTTPTIGAPPKPPTAKPEDPAYREAMAPVLERYHQRFREAFVALDRPTDTTPISLAPDEALRRACVDESARAKRQQAFHHQLSELAAYPPFRAVRRIIEGGLRRVAGG